MVVLVGISLTIIVIAFIWLTGLGNGRKSLNHIPGPKGIPFFGNVFALDMKKPHRWITDQAKKYGPVMILDLMINKVVILSGKDEITQALVTKGNDFSGRPQTFRGTTAYPKTLALADYTHHNRLQKKMMMQYIKAYGSGLAQVETLVLSVTKYLVEDLQSFGSHEIPIRTILRKTLIDMIYLLQFHKRVPSDELPKIEEITEINEQVFQWGGEGTLFDVFPWIRHFKVPIWMKFQKFTALEEELYTKWKQQYDQSNELKDTFIASFFKHNEEKPLEKFDDVSICRSVFLAFFAGTSTTTVTLTWLFNRLAQDKDLQDSLYRENKEVLGNRQVTLNDRKSMPYHEATLNETARYYSILPFMIPHKAVVDSEISGYKIPNGTEVWINMYSYSHDESLWKDPYEFTPNRFLNNEGKLDMDSSDSRFFFFGAGPRVCPGEVFAKIRLFLLLASIVQKFEILPATTVDDQPSCDVRDAPVQTFIDPGDVRIRMIPRVEFE